MQSNFIVLGERTYIYRMNKLLICLRKRTVAGSEAGTDVFWHLKHRSAYILHKTKIRLLMLDMLFEGVYEISRLNFTMNYHPRLDLFQGNQLLYTSHKYYSIFCVVEINWVYSWKSIIELCNQRSPSIFSGQDQERTIQPYSFYRYYYFMVSIDKRISFWV